jgi:hypothetical protein
MTSSFDGEGGRSDSTLSTRKTYPSALDKTSLKPGENESINVSIDSKDIGGLPPQPCSDYSDDFHADTKTCTSFPSATFHRKSKPRTENTLPPTTDPKEIEAATRTAREEFESKRRIWTVHPGSHFLGQGIFDRGIFATFCILFAVMWCVRHNGGIQDGFAIAGMGLAYTAIILGALQALTLRKG